MQLEFFWNFGFGFRTGQVGNTVLQDPRCPTMTPKPPPSSEGSPLPPRHRPNLGDLVKDTTEIDLWAFDDPDPVPGESFEKRAKSPDSTIPKPRDQEKMRIRQLGDPSAPQREASPNLIKINVSKARPKNVPVVPSPSPPTAGDDFGELDHWDEAPGAPVIENFFAEISASPAITPEPAALASPVVPSVEEIPTRPTDEMDEFSPVVPENSQPISLRPHLSLSKVERLGLVALASLLVISGIVISYYTLKRLPTESARVKANDFPVKGKLVTILSAESYWRAPITTGKDADTVRRGTQLLPVLDVTSSGGPAAIRVFFRNSDRDLVGDAVNRSVQSGSTLHIAATAGFEDVGMHAAYRTGQSKPWTIEVYEAPSENSPGQDFKKLFEMNISTNRR